MSYRSLPEYLLPHRSDPSAHGSGYSFFFHQDLANQLFSAYAKVGEARNLASVIGEDELSPIDKKYLEFGKEFEERYIGQGSGYSFFYPSDHSLVLLMQASSWLRSDFLWMGIIKDSAKGRIRPNRNEDHR